MPGLIQAMALLKSCFAKYAGKDGDCSSLTKGELVDLFREELGVNVSGPAADKIFDDLNSDKDGVVDFKEFVIFVAALATCMK